MSGATIFLLIAVGYSIGTLLGIGVWMIWDWLHR